MHAYTWEDPEIHQTGTLNQANQNDWPKETRKKYSKKVIQTAGRVQFKDSPSECASVSSHTYCTLLLLINTSLAPLLSVSVEILFCIVEGPGPLSLTSGPAARIWHSHHPGPARSLAGNPSLAPSRCRPRPPEIRYLIQLLENFSLGLKQLREVNLLFQLHNL